MKYRNRVLTFLFFFSALTYVNRLCIAVATPEMQRNVGLSSSQWGWVLGVFALSYGLFGVPAGWMCDRIGPRRFVAITTPCLSVFTALTGAVANFWQLLVTRFVFGASGAGAFFILKAASTAAENRADLETVTAVARRANAGTRSMGVALSACTVPANGKPTFSLGEGEMEIGLGIHGEPGKRRGPIEPADKVVDEMIEKILGDLDYSGSDVAVLINGLGATPYEELYIIYRRVRQILETRRIRIRHKFVGEYATSLEMAGTLISLLRLDPELHDLMAPPANCPMFKQN
jgi:hypothetical protein